MWKWYDRIYTTYKRRAKEERVGPIAKEKFLEIVNKQCRVLGWMDKITGRPGWIVNEIDDHFCMHARIEGSQVVVNIWTWREREALTGQKRKSA